MEESSINFISVESRIKGDDSLSGEVGKAVLFISIYSSKTQSKLLERTVFSKVLGLLPIISPFSFSISSTGRVTITVCVVVVVRERWNSVVFVMI